MKGITTVAENRSYVKLHDSGNSIGLGMDLIRSSGIKRHRVTSRNQGRTPWHEHKQRKIFEIIVQPQLFFL
jgi:hypothetical protein